MSQRKQRHQLKSPWIGYHRWPGDNGERKERTYHCDDLLDKVGDFFGNPANADVEHALVFISAE